MRDLRRRTSSSDQAVAVVGGGDTAVEDASYLSTPGRASVHPGPPPRQAPGRARYMQPKLRALPNEEISSGWDSVVESTCSATGQGDGRAPASNVKTGAQSELRVDGVFVFIGVLPNTALLQGVVELDPAGYVKTDVDMRTRTLTSSRQGRAQPVGEADRRGRG
ncbi:MAG: NAD(P)/FAD-dependent oxidoreductase [Candidatus Moduliflexus flocculans]|nr:NAD(P)/FAD-dependent oxidoreductase [Candidatus Moduliflexus flocculans]